MMARTRSVAVKIMELLRTMSADELSVLLDLVTAEFRPRKRKAAAKTPLAPGSKRVKSPTPSSTL
jgi:hypothetical protein